VMPGGQESIEDDCASPVCALADPGFGCAVRRWPHIRSFRGDYREVASVMDIHTRGTDGPLSWM